MSENQKDDSETVDLVAWVYDTYVGTTGNKKINSHALGEWAWTYRVINYAQFLTILALPDIPLP